MCSNSLSFVLYKQAMADSGATGRKIVLGVDASDHSVRAFDCKYFQTFYLSFLASYFKCLI